MSKQMLFGYFCNVSNKWYQNRVNMGIYFGKVKRPGHFGNISKQKGLWVFWQYLKQINFGNISRYLN